MLKEPLNLFCSTQTNFSYFFSGYDRQNSTVLAFLREWGPSLSNLFINCPKALNFSFCFSEYTSGYSINSTTINNWNNLFDFNWRLLLAEDIFDCYINSPQANNINFTKCFYNSIMFIQLPKLWEKFPNNTNHINCYTNCVNLPWYNEIPNDWK
jgi:hypothetical protein